MNFKKIGLMVITGILTAGSLYSANLKPYSDIENQNIQYQLTKISQDIERLQRDLHLERLEAMKAEVKSQDYLKTEWELYTQEIQKAERSDVKIMRMEQELQKLEEQKRELLLKFKSQK